MFYGAPMDSDQPTTPPAWELYDLTKDPKEDNNVYDDPAYASVIKDLKQQLKERRAELGEDDPKFSFNKVIEDYWDYDDEDRAKAKVIAQKMYQDYLEHPPVPGKNTNHKK